jgi:hypothetical protein
MVEETRVGLRPHPVERSGHRLLDVTRDAEFERDAPSDPTRVPVDLNGLHVLLRQELAVREVRTEHQQDVGSVERRVGVPVVEQSRHPDGRRVERVAEIP